MGTTMRRTQPIFYITFWIVKEIKPYVHTYMDYVSKGKKVAQMHASSEFPCVYICDGATAPPTWWFPWPHGNLVTYFNLALTLIKQYLVQVKYYWVILTIPLWVIWPKFGPLLSAMRSPEPQMWTCSILTFDLTLTCQVTSISKF